VQKNSDDVFSVEKAQTNVIEECESCSARELIFDRQLSVLSVE
jgi:hypothetical protein